MSQMEIEVRDHPGKWNGSNTEHFEFTEVQVA
jgi:hypothetical protein